MNVLVAIFSQFAAWRIPPVFVAQLREQFPHHRFVQVTDEAGVTAAIDATEIGFLSELRPAQLDRARRLVWIHSPAAGIGGMLFPAMVASPVTISNSSGMSAVTIAEHVIMLALALFRKLPLVTARQAERRWAQDEVMEPPVPRTLAGSKILLVGLGGIGAACATRFAALGATVSGVRRRTGQPMPPGLTTVVPPGELHRMLGSHDVVVLAAAHTRDTRGLMGAPELAAMKKGSFLINVSRGKLVDEQALADALASGHVGGAGLDVFVDEPLDAASPLWRAPNTILTPHVAGFRVDHWEAATALFAENLRRFDAGQPLLNVVDKTAGY